MQNRFGEMSNYSENLLLLRNRIMEELGLDDYETSKYLFTTDVLPEILRAVEDVGPTAWEYLRNFPKGKSFYASQDPVLMAICKQYNQLPSADIHSGASFAIMMRMVETIAKLGFDGFACKIMSSITRDLPKIVSSRGAPPMYSV